MALAPHKPLLLLTIVDFFEEGKIVEKSIVPTEALYEHYLLFWSAIELKDDSSICLPFWHLQNDGHWILIPKKGMESEGKRRPKTDKNSAKFSKKAGLMKKYLITLFLLIAEISLD